MVNQTQDTYQMEVEVLEVEATEVEALEQQTKVVEAVADNTKVAVPVVQESLFLDTNINNKKNPANCGIFYIF